MALKATAAGGVKIYNLSAGKSLPQWLSEKKKKSLRYNEEFRRRIELIQDLEMPTASGRIKMSRDGEFIAMTGTYPPQLRVYEVSQLSMKMDRHLTCDIAQFLMLSDDYSKMVLLHHDRTLEFHAQFGSYYKTRVPKAGRDMLYDAGSCDLYVCGSSPDIYRINLDHGRFMQPLTSNASAVNCCSFNELHRILAFGADNGTLECWDPRSRTRAATLDVRATLPLPSHLRDPSDTEVTAVAFEPDWVAVAVGTSSGVCGVYDLRSSRPLLVKDHMYDLPVHTIRFHAASRSIISADNKLVKIWSANDGSVLGNVEPTADVKDVCLVGQSGLIMLAVEQPRAQVVYIPALGPAPRWASFLDSLTEELEEEKTGSVYDDYKFVTRDDLDQLGLSHVMGTNLLRPYMHGFFIDYRLYAKAVAVAQPFAYDEYRKNAVKQRLEQQRSTRIVAKKRLPAVNTALAKRLGGGKQPPTTDEPGAAGGSDINPLGDQRFAQLFADPEFEIDETSFDFQRMHPHNKNAKAVDGFVADDDDADSDTQRNVRQASSDGDHSSSSQSDEDEEEDEDEDEDEDDSGEQNGKAQAARGSSRALPAAGAARPSKRPTASLYHLAEGSSLVGGHLLKRKRNANVALESLVRDVDKARRKSGGMLVTNRPTGGKEVTFTLASGHESGDGDGHSGSDGDKGANGTAPNDRRNRRGVQELGLREAATVPHSHIAAKRAHRGRGGGGGRGRGGGGGRGGGRGRGRGRS